MGDGLETDLPRISGSFLVVLIGRGYVFDEGTPTFGLQTRRVELMDTLSLSGIRSRKRCNHTKFLVTLADQTRGRSEGGGSLFSSSGSWSQSPTANSATTSLCTFACVCVCVKT